MKPRFKEHFVAYVFMIQPIYQYVRVTRVLL